MPTSQSRAQKSEPEVADLPGFRGEPPEGDHPDEIPGPTSQDQSQTLPPPAEEKSPPEAGRGEDSGRSSPVSISDELHAELENLTGGVFELAGVAINRVVKMRSRSNTRLWLVTEEEAEDFGTAAARILERRVPEELAEGDGADVLIMGSVLLGYGMRNAAGQAAPVPEGTEAPPSYAGPPPASQPPPQSAEPPQAQPSAAASPAAPVRAGSPVVVGVEAATPPPPFSADL